MPDWGSLAVDLGRVRFLARYTHPFLFSATGLAPPPRPMQTEKIDRTQLIRLHGAAIAETTTAGPRVLPIYKNQPTFPSMITVGRTANNDVVIPDVQVSKFHAYFRELGAVLMLEEAGSSNGTWVNGKPLTKGQPLPAPPGTQLRFAAVQMELLDPETCWKRLIDALDPWD